MKILIVGNRSYAKPFEDFGEIIDDWNHDIYDADAIVFTGGHDITPALYGQDKDARTQNDEKRDMIEAGLYQIAKVRGIPMFGICRGSQFLTVMNGGQLHQHVNNHGLSGTHEITTVAGETLAVTSTHHQMMNLEHLVAGHQYELLAWADNLASMGEHEEPEAVLFYDGKALAVQFHPEYMPKHSRGWEYYQELVHTHLLTYSTEYYTMFKQENENHG